MKLNIPLTSLLGASLASARVLDFIPNILRPRQVGNPHGTPQPGHPTSPSQPPNCNMWWTVNPGDFCQSIVNYMGPINLPLQTLIMWNNEINAGCTNLQVGQELCVGVGAGPGPNPPPCNGTAPGPTQQPPPIAICKQWYYVQMGDNCYTIGQKYGQPASNIIMWNPAAGPQCLTLQPNLYACVLA